MHGTRSRRIGLSAATITLLAASIAFGPAPLRAQQAQATREGQPPRRRKWPSWPTTASQGRRALWRRPACSVSTSTCRSGPNSAPIVLFVHGGEWTRHDKSEVSFKPKFFNEHGILFVSTNYRLSPAATHPAHASDVAAAIRWVVDHAAEYGGDPHKIVLMGHSAGCHLVTLVALDPRYLAKVDLRPADLAGVVAWSGGAYDLVQKVEQGGSYAGYIKQTFGESPEAWRDASPAAHTKGVKDRPAFLFASIEPGNASHQASERMVNLIREAGGNATSKMLEGRDHFGANHFLAAPGDATGKIFLQFIDEATR